MFTTTAEFNGLYSKLYRNGIPLSDINENITWYTVPYKVLEGKNLGELEAICLNFFYKIFFPKNRSVWCMASQLNSV